MTVQELFEYLLPVTDMTEGKPSFSVLSIANDITTLLTKELWKLESDLILSEQTFSFAAGTATATVPTGFLGFFTRPYVSGEAYALDPFDLERSAEYEDETGEPLYFRLSQDELVLTPIPDDAVTLKVECFMQPGTVTAMTDSLPLGTLFDEVYKLGGMLMQTTGQLLVVQPEFTAFLKRAVREVLEMRAEPQDRFCSPSY